MAEIQDAYSDAVAYLTANPDQIHRAWSYPEKHEAGCLFNYCDRATGAKADEDSGRHCGCLTQVRHQGMLAQTAVLTKQIRMDERIPSLFDIAAVDLPVFAEWQRKLDKELGRTPPARKVGAK